MFESIKKYKNILIGALIVIAVFVVYSMFFAGEKPGTNILTSSSISGVQSSSNSELLLLLINLKSIRLNDSLFQDPSFGRLRDFGKDLVPEPTGRENPFSPVGSDII